MKRRVWLLVGGVMMALSAWAWAQTKPSEPAAKAGLRVRPPAVAGIFYPADPQKLSDTVDGLLAKAAAQDIGNLRAVIAPHAGYAFSGKTAACAFKQLAARQYSTVVIMGPSHYVGFMGAALPNFDAFRTPLGTVPVAPNLKDWAKANVISFVPPIPADPPGWWRLSPAAGTAPDGEATPHTWEHSVEVEIPFLQRMLKSFNIVPIVFGDMGEAAIEAASQVVLKNTDDKTLLVVSTDLSHYHPDQLARLLDGACVKAILDENIPEMTRQEACGRTPVLVLLHVAKAKGWKAKLLDTSNSSDATGDKSSVVGYAAIAFYGPDAKQPSTPPAAK